MSLESKAPKENRCRFELLSEPCMREHYDEANQSINRNRQLRYRAIAACGKEQRMEKALSRGQKQQVEQASLAKRLKEATRIISGQLASNNHFHLDADGRFAYSKRVRQHEQEQAESESLRTAKCAMRQARVQDQKRWTEMNDLSIDDLKVLVSSIKRDGDSPVRARKQEFLINILCVGWN